MAVENQEYSPEMYKTLRFFELTCERSLGGIVTACYPEGLDIMHVPKAFAKAQAVAVGIIEPVHLLTGSTVHGAIKQTYLPGNFTPKAEWLAELADAMRTDFPEGRWLPPYIPQAERILTREEWNEETRRSGAGSEDPKYFIDVQVVDAQKSDLEKRILDLRAKSGLEIIAEFNGNILPAVSGPVRPEREKAIRAIQHIRAMQSFAIQAS